MGPYHGLILDGARLEAIAELKAFRQAYREALDWVAWTGGGLRSDARDTNQLMEAIADGTLLEPASLAEMTAPTLDTEYGLGLGLEPVSGETAIGHGGGVPGFRSDTTYLPEQDISITVVSNGIPLDSDVGVLTERLAKLLLES